MVCESCKVVIADALRELNIPTINIELGEIETAEVVSDANMKALDSKIKSVGMELLENKEGIVIEQIKKHMNEYIFQTEKRPNINFSDSLASYTFLMI